MPNGKNEVNKSLQCLGGHLIKSELNDWIGTIKGATVEERQR
jgi:hypothetical protein